MQPVIREERPEDVAAIRQINLAAFGGKTEAQLVERLRQRCDDCLSLVAEGDDGELLAHILFTPVVLRGTGFELQGMGLAPMAVVPAWQGRGIGSRLVAEGLRRLDARAVPFVIVLGHPDYYPRFGFVPASRYGIAAQWEGVPDKAFLVRMHAELSLAPSGVVAWYRDEFNEAV